MNKITITNYIVTRIVPRFIKFIEDQTALLDKFGSLKRTDITAEVILEAAKAYILEIISRHSSFSPYLCTKDPTNLEHTVFLSKLFPTAKFILMIRDARATVTSVVFRSVNSGGYIIDRNNQIQSIKANLINWNKLLESMYSQCITVGPERCLPVFYEQLVLHPENEMRKILKFLNIPWNEAVLNHEKYIGEKISLSKTEKSSDQVVKPVNLEGLNAWVGKIPEEILSEIDKLAPLLKKLGYDTKSRNPNYGSPDARVLENVIRIESNQKYWNQLANNYSDLFKLIHPNLV